jgi:hypothetical protein
MFTQKKLWTPNLSEIHQYTQDLQRITMLRDKSKFTDEQQYYSTCIHVMLLVLIFLNTEPGNKVDVS